jgi:hypothetical protein
MHLHKSVIGFVTFFLALALIVPPAERAHWGMQGIFLAMIAATAASFLAAFIFGRARRRLRASQISGRDLAGFMVGYTPATRIVESGSGVHLAPSGDLLSLLDLDDEQALALPDDDAESEEDKREEDEDLPDVIIEPHGLYLSKPYQPGVESILGQTVLFCGIRRSGKSNGMAVLAEEQARYGVPLVVGDTEDEYGPLADHRYMPRGVLVGSLDLLEADSLCSNFIAIDVNIAYQFGQTILQDCLQVVLNLKSFASDEEAALVMCEIIAGMNEWESSRPNASRVPCMFLLDEANKWLPQNERESYVSKEVLTELQKAFFGTMVRRGGKRGLGLALTTQRIVELDKRALQSTWKFLFRQTEQVDIARYKALGLDGEAVQALQPGECFVFSPGVLGFQMMMRARHSPHLAHTPGLNQLRSHVRRVRPIEQVAPTFVNTAATAGNTTTTETCSSLARDTRVMHSRPNTKLERALEVWKAGHQSVRALAAALSTEQERVSNDEAYRLICQLDAKGLITRQKRTVI